MRKLVIFACISFFACPAISPAATNGDKQDQGQLEQLDKRIASLQAKLKMLTDRQALLKARMTKSAKGFTERGQKAYLRELRFTKRAAKKPAKVDPCNPQRIFIRANSLDNYLYAAATSSKAKGASVSLTKDHLTGQQTATISGMASVLAFYNFCPSTPEGGIPFVSGYAVAPYVLAKGNYTQPKQKSEHSALKLGVEAELEISRLGFLRQTFTFAPYYQTDYRNIARVNGANFYWDPVDSRINLGGYLGNGKYLDWFWQLRAEADVRNVSDPGLTNLADRDYAWGGGTAAIHFFLLPDADVPDFFRNRFVLSGTASYFYDFQSNVGVHLFEAELQYKLTPDGNSSIAFDYKKGTDKDTMVEADKYTVSLTYAY